MALKDIFKMTKANRYTADGREELIKAQEAEVEDRRYKIGEISEKTGLQKTANGWVKPKNGKQAGAKKEESKPGRDYPVLKKDDHVKLAKEVMANGDNWTTEEIAKEWKLGKADAEEVKKAIQALKTHKGVEKTLSNMEQAKKIQAGVEALEKKRNAESKPAEQKKAPKPTMQQYMKAKQDIKQFEDTYKKQNEQYEARQRMGEGAAALSPLWGLKPNDYKNDPQYKKAAELVKAFEAEDSAPRVLTGDCKVRIRKA